MTGGGAPRVENISNSLFDNRPRGLQKSRVQVSLHDRSGHLGNGPRQVRLPVDTHAVRANLGHVGQDRGAARPEVDERGALAGHGTDGTGDALHDHARVRCDGLAIGTRRDGPHPRVEELRSTGPDLDLRGDEVGAHARAPAHERVPRARVGCGKSPRGHVIAGRTPLNHVRGQSEGGTTESDERRGSQLAHRRRDTIAHALGALGAVSRAPSGVGPRPLAVAMTQ